MKNLITTFAFIVILSTIGFPQTVNLAARTAVDKEGVMTKNFAEVSVEKSRWTIFDIVAIGKPDGRTSELAVGGGYKLVSTPRLTWTSELFLVKDLGERTKRGWYMQPLNSLSGGVGKGGRWQAVIIPYTPLTSTAKFQLVLERARLVLNTNIGTICGGVGGAKSGANQFQWRPLASFQPKGWPVDFWYQVYLPTPQAPHTRHTFQARFAWKVKVKG